MSHESKCSVNSIHLLHHHQQQHLNTIQTNNQTLLQQDYQMRDQLNSQPRRSFSTEEEQEEEGMSEVGVEGEPLSFSQVAASVLGLSTSPASLTTCLIQQQHHMMQQHQLIQHHHQQHGLEQQHQTTFSSSSLQEQVSPVNTTHLLQQHMLQRINPRTISSLNTLGVNTCSTNTPSSYTSPSEERKFFIPPPPAFSSSTDTIPLPIQQANQHHQLQSEIISRGRSCSSSSSVSLVHQQHETDMNEGIITGPHLTIVEQPTNRIRYRYKSEKGSHGGLTGENNTQAKKTYPTVRVSESKCKVYGFPGKYSELKYKSEGENFDSMHGVHLLTFLLTHFLF